MSKRLLFLLLAIIIISFQLLAQKPVKRVLLEQHTGAWCGWCVDGSVKMEELETLYPDRVLGVKFHNGDSMAIPEQDEIGNALGLTGFPTGSINRLPYSGAIFLDRTNWKAAAEAELLKPAKVEVSLVYSLDESTRELIATVSCKAVEDINEDLMFNVYIIEDSVSGIGTGWNQSNYYSKNATYPTHPYYSLPNPIVGYQHMRVVRQLLGGSWGAFGEIPNPTVTGETYYHTFKTTINPKWDLTRLSFVGLVQANSPNNKAVFNCATGVKGTPKIPAFQMIATGDGFDVKKSGDTFTRTFQLTNITNSDVTGAVSINKSANLPSDWVVKTSPENEITIKPNETKDVTLSITPGNTIGLGFARIFIADKNNPNGIKATGLMGAISQEIEKFEVIAGANASYSLETNLNQTNHPGYFKIDPSYFTPYSDKFTNKKVLIFNTGAVGNFTSADGEAIVSSFKNGTQVFVIGNLAVNYLNTYKLLTFFGAEFVAVSREGYGSAPWRIWLQGFNNDVISSDFGALQEGNLINYLLTTMKIIDIKKTKPVLAFTKSVDSIVALRTYYNGNKGFLMGLCQNVIVDANVRNQLISNAIDWLEGKIVEGIDDDVVKSSNGKILLQVYPNPFTDNSKVKLQINGTTPEYLRIYLTDEAGNIIRDYSSSAYEAGNHEIAIDGLLANGSYKVVIHCGNETMSAPIIKMK